MNEVIKWGAHEYKAGDVFTAINEHQPIIIKDIFLDGSVTYVVLKQGDNNPELMKADLFAYCVETKHFTKVAAPLFKVGERFVHQYNNSTVTILSVSPTLDAGGRQYFISLLEETGEFIYTSTNESYLLNCIKLTDTPNNSINKPVLTGSEEFPAVSYVVK